MFFLPSPQLDAARLDAILNDPRLAGAIVSAIVTDTEGHVLYAKDEARHVVPASNQKILTASFALSTLGPEFRPETRFWKLSDGLHVSSDGDPMMRSEDLVAARKKLWPYNDSKVWVQEAYAPQVPSTWEWDDLPNKYAAAVDAFTVDRGSFELWVSKGKPVFRPFAYGVRLESHPSTDPLRSDYDPFSRKAVVSGNYPLKDVRVDTLALPRPDEAAASLLGKRFEPSDSSPTTPPDLALKGHTTMETIASCLPPSDNNLAEGLLMLATSRLSVRKEDSYIAARREMTRFLTTVVGIDPRDLHVTDGSGMSREDFVTTRAIAKILVWSLGQPTKDAWKAAMSTPTSGTIKGRLTGIDFAGKTGSLNMVSSLSGYLRTKSGRQLVVSVVMNEFTIPNSEVHQVQDAFVRGLANDSSVGQ